MAWKCLYRVVRSMSRLDRSDSEVISMIHQTNRVLCIGSVSIPE